MQVTNIPLFPLHTVLLPGGRLSLRIFEPRYLKMVSDCLRHEAGFGVVQISSGEEVGEEAEVFEVGTLSRITDWHQRSDGLLGITVEGEQRFRLLERYRGSDNLQRGQVILLQDGPDTLLPKEHYPLAHLLRDLLEALDQPYINLPRHYEDAGWVASRLTELLPLNKPQRQLLVELGDPLERLERLNALLSTAH